MSDTASRAFEDKHHELNSTKFHTGKPCIDCTNPAGTWWSPLWCFDCNVKRMKRIDRRLAEIEQALKEQREGQQR